MCQQNFNPRPLAGATPAKQVSWFSNLFQSTPPCGGDQRDAVNPAGVLISIHAPLRGRRSASHLPIPLPDFNPRPLAGATRLRVLRCLSDCYFNPRPLAGATRGVATYGLSYLFQSTPPCGGDWVYIFYNPNPCDFNPRPLAGATRRNG